MGKLILYWLLIILLTVSIPFLIYGAINTMVSLQYETAHLGDCISYSGQNLCLEINILAFVAIIFSVSAILLLKFKEKIVKNVSNQGIFLLIFFSLVVVGISVVRCSN